MDAEDRIAVFKTFIAKRRKDAYKEHLIRPHTDNKSKILNENVNDFMNEIRKKLYSNKRYSFREWLLELEDIIDIL